MLAPRLTAVVVLPTPPFWFATATTVPTRLNLRFRSVGKVFGGERPCPLAANGGIEARPVQGLVDFAPGWAVTQTPCRRRPKCYARGRFRAIPARRGKRSRRGRDLAVDVQMAVLGGRIRLHRDHLLHRHAHLLRGSAPASSSAESRAPFHATSTPSDAQQRRRVLDEHRQRPHRPRRHRVVRLAPAPERRRNARIILHARGYGARVARARPPGSAGRSPPSFVPPTRSGQPALEGQRSRAPARETLHLRRYPRSGGADDSSGTSSPRQAVGHVNSSAASGSETVVCGSGSAASAASSR